MPIDSSGKRVSSRHKEPPREQIKEAFKKTIERWERMVKDPDYYSKSHCHLCYLNSPNHNCNDYCPIQLYGNHIGCENTPWHAFFYDRTPENAMAELNFLRKVYIWWLDKELNKIWEKYGIGGVKEECKETCGTCENFIFLKLGGGWGRCIDPTKTWHTKRIPEELACERWRKAKEKRKGEEASVFVESKEWEDVTKECSVAIKGNPMGGYLEIYHKGNTLTLQAMKCSLNENGELSLRFWKPGDKYKFSLGRDKQCFHVLKKI